MGNLAINDHVKALIRMDKGIELIVSIMQQYESSNLSVTSRCCYALSNLAFQSAENVTEMTSENTCLPVVTRVLNSLSDKLSNDVQLFDEETDVFESALCLLSNLATTNDTVRLSIIRNGAGGVLSALATALPHVDSDLSPLSFTLKTLASLALCAHPEGLPVLCRDHHLIGSMCVLLRKHASHVATLDLILSVVANIAVGSEAETLSALIYAGTLPYIDEAGAQHTTNVEIQTNILIVIGNILSRSHVLNNEQRFETERACANCVLNVMTALPSDENIIHHCLRLVMRLVQVCIVLNSLCIQLSLLLFFFFPTG
jgi:hypothetical protein